MNSKYRQAMFFAFSLPVALFVLFPFAVVLLAGPRESSQLVDGMGALLGLLLPIYSVGLLLAPWAGRRIETKKGPAFLMAAAAALSPAILFTALAAIPGNLGLSLGAAGFFAFFALPASVLGALLFIGTCERLNASGPSPVKRA